MEGTDKAGAGEPAQPGSPGPDLNEVAARKNLNETAFFFPQLVSDAEGAVRMEFTMPEALTKWKFLGFAHDKELRSGFLTDTVVTAKDLMVQPNPPRFLREGDVIEFPVKVSNQSATRQGERSASRFRDARTDKPVDAELGLTVPTRGSTCQPGSRRHSPGGSPSPKGPARWRSRPWRRVIDSPTARKGFSPFSEQESPGHRIDLDADPRTRGQRSSTSSASASRPGRRPSGISRTRCRWCRNRPGMRSWPSRT
jgi:hypothetical protein